MEFNRELTAAYFGKRVAIAFDSNHINKSGKKTAYLASFWSGSDQAVKKELEISEITVIDLDLHHAFHLEAVQTVPPKTLKVVSMSLIIWYAQIICSREEELQKISSIVVADAYFSKIKFVNPLLDAGFHVISKLRNDAHLRYKFTGEYAGSGRPCQYAGKIKLDKLDMDIFTEFQFSEDTQAFSAIVNLKSLKRDILVIVERKIDQKGKITQ